MISARSSFVSSAVLGLLLFGRLMAMPATYYASPAGGGDGQSEATSFRIADFWSRAKSGDTLLLLDGVYRGAESMITPPRGLKGESGRPITMRALHDGRVEIDGENEEPLWPWPMNQQIIDAMKSAGQTPVDVTATIEQLLGPIPKELK